jgi:hypothetical protein
MSVPDLLFPAFLKLRHADSHFSELGREIRAFLDAHPLELTADDPDVDGWRVVRVGDVEPAPAEWGVVLGDGIHDCRSALDNAVAALCRLAGGEPAHANEFPILVDQAENARERKIARALDGIPRMWQGPIRDAQPYVAGERRREHPLAVLQALSNADKHRLVHIGTLTPSEGQYRYNVEVGNEVVEQRRSASSLTLASGSEVFRLRVAPNPAAAVGAELEMSLLVGFATAPSRPPVATMPQLADIYRYLWNLLVAMIPYFANHVRLNVPDEIREQATRAKAELSHAHDGEQMRWLPDGPAETVTVGEASRTFRRYVCPRCGTAGYADMAGEVRLE